MRKIPVLLAIILFIVVAVFPVYSQSDIAFGFNIGNFGLGVNFPANDKYTFEVLMSFLSIGLQSQSTGLGFEFVPLTINSWFSSYDYEIDSMNLLYLKLYWNIFNADLIYMGPFASFNYFYIDEYFLWDRYMFKAGLHFGVKLNYRQAFYNILNAEIAYNNINGRSKYYIGAKVDLIALAFLFL